MPWRTGTSRYSWCIRHGYRRPARWIGCWIPWRPPNRRGGFAWRTARRRSSLPEPVAVGVGRFREHAARPVPRAVHHRPHRPGARRPDQREAPGADAGGRARQGVGRRGRGRRQLRRDRLQGRRQSGARLAAGPVGALAGGAAGAVAAQLAHRVSRRRGAGRSRGGAARLRARGAVAAGARQPGTLVSRPAAGSSAPALDPPDRPPLSGTQGEPLSRRAPRRRVARRGPTGVGRLHAAAGRGAPPGRVGPLPRAGEQWWTAAVESLLARPDVHIVVTPRDAAQGEQLAPVYRGRRLTVLRQATDGAGLIAAADLVLGGGGTMNREAAVLGTHAWSTFCGPPPAIDECLAREGRLTWVRSAGDLARAVAAPLPASAPRGPYPEAFPLIFSDLLHYLPGH